MSKGLEDYKSELPAFAEEINQYIQELGIAKKVKELEADHVALRLKNSDEVENMKEEALADGKLLSSAVINGRTIYIIELNQPLQLGTWKVSCIELPHPKRNQPYADGWEHVEFVLPSSPNSLEDFRSKFQEAFPELHIQALQEQGQYTEMVPVADHDRELPNPCLCLEKRKNVAIKFHPNSIKEVVRS